MEFTGERAIPGQTDPDLMNEHWARYAFAEALVGAKRVLDAGCGVGYGAARLAEVAADVVALDQARDPLAAGGKQYSHPHLRFVQGDCTRFPFADSSLDAVVAFEVIEHLDEWKALIEESRRVLTPAGQFIVSTPNRLYYGESREDPNPFHVHEFTHDEFREELGRCFPHVMLFLENHADALVFAGEQVQGIRARLETADQAPDEAHFFLAVCSQRPLYGSPTFVYLPSSANLLREREKHIGMLQGEVNKRDEWLAAARVELDKFNAVQESAKKTIAQLEQETADKENWARQLDGELAGVRAEREKCIQWLEDSEKRVTERTDWARAGEMHPMARRFREAGDRAHRLGAAARWRVGGCPRRAGEMHPMARRFREAEHRAAARELAGVRAERAHRLTEAPLGAAARWRVGGCPRRAGEMHPIARRCRAARDRAHRLGAAARWRVG